MGAVWVVMGSCGEYSDRYEWPHRVFATEAEAQAEVDFLDAKWREVLAGKPFCERSYGERSALIDRMRLIVPEFGSDETYWSVSETPWGPRRPTPPAEGGE